ncbi:MAG: TetR/AcrR family transcriptional regulator [Chloroflexi bacterium]|nr:TetR/AcrR family transcriptional regulator [Chloroflexota bacterium]MYD16494.1 TetR/AcrR family transcriptional regulator [Chloroflexota bacterium]MYJ01440.1 TetR/AcrR family transcriptional regulator [Chloroflexota bacterium]
MTTSAPRQARAIERREHLLDAAAQVFAQRGYSDAQMDEIAAAADTSKGGLYFHFPNKEALIAAVIGRAGDILRRRVTRAMTAAGDDPVARADAALATLVNTLAAHRSLARVLAAESLGSSTTARESVAKIEDEYVALIADELRAALASGRLSNLDAPLDPELTARAWVGMVRSLLTAWAAGRVSAPLDRIYPELRRLMLRSAGVPLESNHLATHAKE